MERQHLQELEIATLKHICEINGWGICGANNKKDLVDHIVNTYMTLSICCDMEHITETKREHLIDRCEHINNIIEMARR